MKTMNTHTHRKDIESLNSFLRGEKSAIETYDQVIAKAENEGVARELRDNRESHWRRAGLIESEIRKLGGEPSADAGAWGAFAKTVEGGAKLFGLSAAVSVLEEGEDHGLKDYRKDQSDLTPATRAFVNEKLLPEQQRTHDRLSALDKRV
jgi:hypothetical protein